MLSDEIEKNKLKKQRKKRSQSIRVNPLTLIKGSKKKHEDQFQ
jgi:hypothetical protein